MVLLTSKNQTKDNYADKQEANELKLDSNLEKEETLIFASADEEMVIKWIKILNYFINK